MIRMINYNSPIAFHPTNKRIVEFMINMTEQKGRVLDAGFGEGAFLDVLTQKSFSEIIGIEYSKEFFDKAYYLNAKLINSDFLTYKSKKKFDLIIGNPPYMKCSLLNEDMQNNLEKICKTKASDIYYGFIINSIKLLKENGTLLFILPKSFFTNKYASFLRKFILSNGYFEEIIDLGELNVFDTANVETIIFKFKKNKDQDKKNKIKVWKVNKRVKFEKAFDDLKKSYIENIDYGVFDFLLIDQFDKKEEYWYLGKNKKDYQTIPLSEIVEIGVGSVSGCDEVFKISNEEEKKLSKKEKDKFILNFLKANNISNYSSKSDLTPMLFFDKEYKSIDDLFLFPNIQTYLEKNKDKLYSRYFSNKKKPYFSWLAIRNHKVIEYNKNNPILFVPSLTRKKSQWFNISFHKNRYVSADILYLIPKEPFDIYFILGFLNSDFFSNEFNQFGMKKGERFVFNQGFLSKFNIPYLDTKVQAEISIITQNIINEFNRKKWSEKKISRLRLEIDKIIKENTTNINGKPVFGQLSFDF